MHYFAQGKKWDLKINLQIAIQCVVATLKVILNVKIRISSVPGKKKNGHSWLSGFIHKFRKILKQGHRLSEMIHAISRSRKFFVKHWFKRLFATFVHNKGQVLWNWNHSLEKNVECIILSSSIREKKPKIDKLWIARAYNYWKGEWPGNVDNFPNFGMNKCKVNVVLSQMRILGWKVVIAVITRVLFLHISSINLLKRWKIVKVIDCAWW